MYGSYIRALYEWHLTPRWRVLKRKRLRRLANEFGEKYLESLS